MQILSDVWNGVQNGVCKSHNKIGEIVSKFGNILITLEQEKKKNSLNGAQIDDQMETCDGCLTLVLSSDLLVECTHAKEHKT